MILEAKSDKKEVRKLLDKLLKKFDEVQHQVKILREQQKELKVLVPYFFSCFLSTSSSSSSFIVKKPLSAG